MALDPRRVDELVLSVVLQGSFNPRMLRPDWFIAQGILGDQLQGVEGQEAVSDLLVHETLTRWRTNQLSLEVTLDSLMIITRDQSFEPALESVLERTFSLLSHTPISTVRFDRWMHYVITTDMPEPGVDAPSTDDRDDDQPVVPHPEVHARLLRLATRRALDLLPNSRVSSLALTSSLPGSDGEIALIIEASAENSLASFVNVVETHDLNARVANSLGGSGEDAVRVFKDVWKDARGRAESLFDSTATELMTGLSDEVR